MLNICTEHEPPYILETAVSSVSFEVYQEDFQTQWENCVVESRSKVQNI